MNNKPVSAISLIVLLTFTTTCNPIPKGRIQEMIPMRDGIKLATDIYFPEKSTPPFHVVLIRTPYGKNLLQEYGEFYSSRGFATAIQDVRGKYDSDGDWEPYTYEGKDGYDAIEWLAKQEWSSGRVGMVGGSYSGSVQLAAAIEKPPHLVTIIPNITPATPFNNTPYENGAFAMGWGVRWSDLTKDDITGQEMNQKFSETFTRDWYSELNELPVIDLDKKITDEEITYWRKWIDNPPESDYYRHQDYLTHVSNIKIPVFLQSGWFDVATKGTKHIYNSLSESGNENLKLVIGPWVHSDRSSSQLGGQDLGEKARMPLFNMYSRWFEYWLGQIDNGIMSEPQVSIFNLGPNDWIFSDSYPPKGTTDKFLYLSKECDQENKESGWLKFEKPDQSKCFATYTYDPANPAPSFSEYLKKNQIDEYRRIVESRQDVLVFETEPFESSITLAGSISAVIYASSSAPDTDFSLTMSGLDEAGSIFPIGQTFGIVRAKYRNSNSKPELLEPDRVYEFNIDLAHTGYTFKPGEKIRVEISSSAYPDFSRNLNTGKNSQTTTEFKTARQEIHFSPDHPSHLKLTIMEQ